MAFFPCHSGLLWLSGVPWRHRATLWCQTVLRAGFPRNGQPKVRPLASYSWASWHGTTCLVPTSKAEETQPAGFRWAALVGVLTIPFKPSGILFEPSFYPALHSDVWNAQIIGGIPTAYLDKKRKRQNNC